jgi:N-dimethylarginine dimethylaminohydrolase
MLFEFPTAEAQPGDGLVLGPALPRWGVDSEYGRLLDVMVSPAPHLEIVPCNSVAIAALADGLDCCADAASVQHAALVAALEGAGARCHAVSPLRGMPDLSFTRDTTSMTPWGLLPLAPAVAHRQAEVQHIVDAAREWGVPILARVSEGCVEGGDICLLRPGIVVIGYSGERTDAAGAASLAGLFEARGWEAILYRFDPDFLHLDTHFTMIDERRALACVDALSPPFLARMESLGVELVPVTRDEVRRLGANILSLGGGRLVSSLDNGRVNGLLDSLGYQVIRVDVGQFARCGGGIHCLTMPLARAAA